MIDIISELEKYGLNEETYKKCLSDIDAKMNGTLDIDWSEIKEKYGIVCNPDTIRKGTQSIFGGFFRTEFLKNEMYEESSDDSRIDELDKKLSDIRKERIKLQTANLERTRIERNEARHELYYEQVSNAITALQVPDFNEIPYSENDVEYVLTIADIHYGSKFDSINNSYSPEIAKERFEYLAGYVFDFVNKHNISKLNVVNLSDSIQGILRLSDLKINDSSVVKATVEVSRLIASFLNEISTVVNVDYYHAPTANHSQMRNLGSKASELADEDLEYVISNFIKDSLRNNNRINVHLADEGDQYIVFNINGFDIIAGHGHKIKNVKTSLRDLNDLRYGTFSYCLLGHLHGSNTMSVAEGAFEDKEVIICPSFIGSDPYSDSLMVGAKAACQILGFDSVYGHTETYKIILN